MYLIDWTKLQYLFHIKMSIKSLGQYKRVWHSSMTVHMNIYCPLTFTTTDRPLSATDHRRYNGYPSLSVVVSAISSLGNRLENLTKIV